ncbi:hypothetical protein [Endozoicomonas sp. Mp262]|uniref:DUF748 domain-containing protein n=1 Tax=Endozoicomonas sp. Mp262 TaxID=2919499 RepID=UPI0021DAFEE5
MNKKMRLFLRKFIVLCLSYLIIGFVAVPPLLHLTISQLAPSYLSVPLKIGAIRFNPITLKLTIDTMDAGGIIGFSQLSVDLAWDSFLEQKLHIQSIEVQRLYGAAVLEKNGKTNLETILYRQSDKPKDMPTQNKKSRPLLIQIDSVILKYGKGYSKGPTGESNTKTPISLNHWLESRNNTQYLSSNFNL